MEILNIFTIRVIFSNNQKNHFSILLHLAQSYFLSFVDVSFDLHACACAGMPYFRQQTSVFHAFFGSNTDSSNLDLNDQWRSLCICIKSSIHNVGNMKWEKITVTKMRHTTNHVSQAFLLHLNLWRAACMSHAEHHRCKLETPPFLLGHKAGYGSF